LDGLATPESCPSAAKAAIKVRAGGTAEAVPFHNTVAFLFFGSVAVRVELQPLHLRAVLTQAVKTSFIETLRAANVLISGVFRLAGKAA